MVILLLFLWKPQRWFSTGICMHLLQMYMNNVHVVITSAYCVLQAECYLLTDVVDFTVLTLFNYTEL